MPDDADNARRDRLPFEPGGRKAKGKAKGTGAEEEAAPAEKPARRKLNPIPPELSSRKQAKAEKEKASGDRPARRRYTREERAIPDAVSKRMVRRVAVFSGIPTALGMSSFLAGYWVNVGTQIELPNVVVLLTSAGFFGLGVLGITYGVLSASWDTDAPGSALGLSEFQLNAGRLYEGWKESREARRRERSDD